MRKRRKALHEGAEEQEVPETATTDLSTGPHDADEIDLEEDPAFARYIDLGGLLMPPPPDWAELRLQVDEQSGEVLAVLLAGESGALELRPFAAPRNGDLWTELRGAIRAETTSHGGTTSERSGDFGTELLSQLPVTTPEGEPAVQPSRVIGVAGPRWLLRATLLGVPAMEPFDSDEWEGVLRSVVVRRGAGAMPVGEALPLTMPTADDQTGDPDGRPDGRSRRRGVNQPTVL